VALRSIRGAVGLFVFLSGVAVDTARAADPGFKLGLSVNDQFGTASMFSGFTDTYADRQIVPSLFVSVPFGRWRWVPSLSLLYKGGYIGYDVTDSSLWGAYRDGSHKSLSYLSCHSDVHFTFPLGDASFYFLAAPRVDILLSDKGYHSHPSSGSPTAPWSAPPYEPVTFGVSLGIGQDITVGEDVLFFEFRYDRDWTPYWSTEAVTFPGGGVAPSSWYNRLFIVQIGVRVNAARHATPNTSTELWPPGGTEH